MNVAQARSAHKGHETSERCVKSIAAKQRKRKKKKEMSRLLLELESRVLEGLATRESAH